MEIGKDAATAEAAQFIGKTDKHGKIKDQATLDREFEGLKKTINRTMSIDYPFRFNVHYVIPPTASADMIKETFNEMQRLHDLTDKLVTVSPRVFMLIPFAGSQNTLKYHDLTVDNYLYATNYSEAWNFTKILRDFPDSKVPHLLDVLRTGTYYTPEYHASVVANLNTIE